MDYQGNLFNENEAASFLNSSSPSLQSLQEIKYHSLYKEYSCLRNQFRGLKHQNSWLTNIKNGLQEQNFILKEALKQKKQVVLNVNEQLKSANKQIERLQDQLYDKDTTIQKLTCKIQNLETQNTQKSKYLTTLEIQNKQTKMKFQNLQFTIKQDKKDVSNGLCNMLKLIMNKLSKQFVSKQMFESFQNNKQKIQFSNIFNQIGDGFKSYQKEVCRKIQKIQQRNLDLQKQVKVLKEQQQNINQQLSEATNLLDQQNQRHYVSNKQFDSLKYQIQIQKKENQRLKCINQKSYEKYIKTLNILKKMIPGEVISLIQSQNKKYINSQVFDQAKKYEQKVFFQELQNYCQKLQLKQKRQSKIIMKYYQSKNVNVETTQQLQLTKLKLVTLERQYNQILQDNRRLIKFNNLTKFRLQRNYQKQQQMLTSRLFGRKKSQNQNKQTKKDQENRENQINQKKTLNKVNLQEKQNCFKFINLQTSNNQKPSKQRSLKITQDLKQLKNKSSKC